MKEFPGAVRVQQYDNPPNRNGGIILNHKIICKPLDANDIPIAVDMALENYNMEKQAVPALSNCVTRDLLHKKIEVLFQTGIGYIALEENEPVGFLAFRPIFDTGNGSLGATSPIYGYGIRNQDRGKVIGKLFQSTASTLCEQYAQSLRVSVYAHDVDVLSMYIMSAFAMDTTNVVRSTSASVPADTARSFTFAELDKVKVLQYRTDVIELYRSLINHLRFSPVFYHCKGFFPIEDRFEDFLDESMRIFAVFDKEQLIGMIDSEPTDIELAMTDPYAIGMGDVFIKPAYRGLGLGAALLQYANHRLSESGVERIYVTHGTINPTARGFWDKYFSNYSYTMTRKINPEMLGILKSI